MMKITLGALLPLIVTAEEKKEEKPILDKDDKYFHDDSLVYKRPVFPSKDKLIRGSYVESSMPHKFAMDKWI